MKNSDSQVVVVTGAAGGMGRSIISAFQSQNYTVIGIDRVEKPAELDCIWHRVDVTAHKKVELVAENVFNEFGRLDVWINNAGSLERGPAIEVTAESWETSIAVNLSAVFYGSQAAAKHMIPAKQGLIINMSSYTGISARTQCPGYAVGKAGVIHLTKCLAAEWGPLGVRVNAIAPGYVDTPMLEWMKKEEGAEQQLKSRAPLGRFASPLEIASAMTYLASSDATYITGHTMVIDGGMAVASL